MVENFVDIGEEIHIYIGDDLVFDGKYTKDNPYAKREVYAIGWEEEIESEPIKEWTRIDLYE